MSVGRDGASDAISFLMAGVPAVEFGPRRRWPPRSRGMGLDRIAGDATATRLWTSSTTCRSGSSKPEDGGLRAIEGGLGVSPDLPPDLAGGMLKRALIAAVAIVLLCGGAVSAAVILQVDELKNEVIEAAERAGPRAARRRRRASPRPTRASRARS